MHILLLKWRWGVVVNFKVGKAAAPACEFSWIGYLFKLRPRANDDSLGINATVDQRLATRALKRKGNIT